jgi:hypothetical protein
LVVIILRSKLSNGAFISNNVELWAKKHILQPSWNPIWLPPGLDLDITFRLVSTKYLGIGVGIDSLSAVDFEIYVKNDKKSKMAVVSALEKNGNRCF